MVSANDCNLEQHDSDIYNGIQYCSPLKSTENTFIYPGSFNIETLQYIVINVFKLSQ